MVTESRGGRERKWLLKAEEEERLKKDGTKNFQTEKIVSKQNL